MNKTAQQDLTRGFNIANDAPSHPHKKIEQHATSIVEQFGSLNDYLVQEIKGLVAEAVLRDIPPDRIAFERNADELSEMTEAVKARNFAKFDHESFHDTFLHRLPQFIAETRKDLDSSPICHEAPSSVSGPRVAALSYST